MKDRVFTPLNRQRLLWAAVCGLLAVAAVLLFVAWRGSLAVPPEDSLLVRRTVLDALAWPVPAVLALELALAFGFGASVGLAVPPMEGPGTAVAARTAAPVVSRSGSPQVMKAMKAFPFSKARLILLIDILPSVTCYGGTILVSPARYSYDDDFVSAHLRSDLQGMSHSMSRFHSRYDAFRPGQIFKSAHRLFICNGNVFRPAGVVQVSVLRPDTGIIESCGNGINRCDLSVFILTEVGFHPVKDARFSGGYGGCRFKCIRTSSGGFASDEPDAPVADKMIKAADGIGSSAYTGDDGIRKASFSLENLFFYLF